MTLAVDTSDRIYDDFLRLLFLSAHRESSALSPLLMTCLTCRRTMGLVNAHVGGQSQHPRRDYGISQLSTANMCCRLFIRLSTRFLSVWGLCVYLQQN
jgi:hypothetical protein